jgi:hypothetical protein
MNFFDFKRISICIIFSQTRNQRCNEMRLDRQLLERLLSTWKKIKDVRRTNGYTTTSVRLIIKQFVLCSSFFFISM